MFFFRVPFPQFGICVLVRQSGWLCVCVCVCVYVREREEEEEEEEEEDEMILIWFIVLKYLFILDW